MELPVAEAGILLREFVNATNGMQELDVVLGASGANLTGWQLTRARGISADGEPIVGYGTNPLGQTEAFIAVIPEPTTALLMGLGLASVKRRVD